VEWNALIVPRKWSRMSPLRNWTGQEKGMVPEDAGWIMSGRNDQRESAKARPPLPTNQNWRFLEKNRKILGQEPIQQPKPQLLLCLLLDVFRLREIYLHWGSSKTETISFSTQVCLIHSTSAFPPFFSFLSSNGLSRLLHSPQKKERSKR